MRKQGLSRSLVQEDRRPGVVRGWRSNPPSHDGGEHECSSFAFGLDIRREV